MNPSEILLRGVSLLNPLLRGHGFGFQHEGVGEGSRGLFSAGSFVREDRRIEVVFTRSLDRVTLVAGDSRIALSAYVKVVSGGAAGDYEMEPGREVEALCRIVADDLETHGQLFLSGSEGSLRELMQNIAQQIAKGHFT